MATTVRSVGAMPFQGGQFSGSYIDHSMVRLTNSRMIWLYYQTSPNWLAASVIDVPGGITGTGSPMLTNQQLLFPAARNGYMTCGRINQNTFVMMTSIYTGSMSWYVIEVDAAGVFTRVDQGTLTYGASNSGNSQYSFGSGNFKIVELKDNLVMYVGKDLSGTTNILSGAKGNYDAVNKKMTWDGAVTGLITIRNSGNYEIIARPVPGRDMTMLQLRYSGPSTVGLISGASGVVINNQTGAIAVNQSKLPQDSGTAGSDMVPLPGDRIAYLINNYTIQWFSVDYINGSFINLGSSQFTSTQSTDSVGHYLLPLTADYVLKMQRQPMSVINGQQRFKVIRRVDQNMSEQSPNSASNNNAGFGASAPTTTVAAFNQSYPEFIDGKVVWFGLDSSTAATKFSWTVIGLDQA